MLVSLIFACMYQSNIVLADNKIRRKKKTKRLKKKHATTSIPCANGLPVNAISGSSTKANIEYEGNENSHTDNPGIYTHV